MIRVLIVEDQRMAREDMENYIQSSGRYCLAASITNAAMAETVCRQSRCEAIFLFPVSNIKVEFYHISESIFIFIVYRYIQHKWHRGSTSGSPPFYRVIFWSMP